MENNETQLKGSYNFSEINYKILKKITNLTLKRPENKFDKWFNYPYKLKKEEEEFLKQLIDKEALYFQYYNEELQKARFIFPLLYRVDFAQENFRDWYEYGISGIVNGYKLSGKPDFMVASGKIEPDTPFFFIQEFKPTVSSKRPDFQLLAEMAVALEINKTNSIRGVYNVGQHWRFIILEKTKQGKFQYYESKNLDCLNFEHLKQIYINLQVVKADLINLKNK